ncbi:MAG: SEL1-like repeat protein [Cyanobacteria bacterium SIG28]|nr:SEL1-like repeat protein [Cyanobacteria bacterium SIG28]
MDYEFLSGGIDKNNINLKNSDKINPFLLKNDPENITKGIEFFGSEEKFLYIHGFIGSGKRQFVNYITEFLDDDVIKLEYYCKQATVCDDILLNFIDCVESLPIAKAISLNAKITTMPVKFSQLVSSIKKPFLIVLHSLDDAEEKNKQAIAGYFSQLLQEKNVKIIVSTRVLDPNILADVTVDRKISMKPFSKEVFKEFLEFSEIKTTDKYTEDFYKYTRGYYYYTALAIKIMQAMKISLPDFVLKLNQSGMSFDSFLGSTYVNLVPVTIRNFFWFLRTVRHGISLNALAVFELYDEFSIEYLKTNLMIFEHNEVVFVQDFFLQNIDISIPEKTEIKLHKYIIGIYEKQLKESIKNRVFLLSRQSMRAEIEFHSQYILNIESRKPVDEVKNVINKSEVVNATESIKNKPLTEQIQYARQLINDKKYNNAIEELIKISENIEIDLQNLIEVRLNLAKLYKLTENYKLSSHYFDLVETYYKQHKEFINLNYLYYDMTDLYFKMYKHQRAIDTIKKVIYSVDTPQSLMVSACTLLGNIYSDINIPKEAYSYYKKALESLDENVEPSILAELYFKFALANDENEDYENAFDYYNKCIGILKDNNYRSLAYSNLASCYYERDSIDEAKAYFSKAYDIEKELNNYDGIYYNALKLAQIYMEEHSKKALPFLLEAQKSAEFLNEAFYMIESSIALGDFYYDNPQTHIDALREYYKAKSIAMRVDFTIDYSKIDSRIKDMKLRLPEEEFSAIEKKYEK